MAPRSREAAGWTLTATCPLGLEEVVRAELRALGLPLVADDGEPRGAVRFSGGLDAMYRANVWLRAAMRVLVGLSCGAVRSREDLYALATAVQWEDWLGRDGTIAVGAAGQNPAFGRADFAALVVKDAIVDRLRRLWGARPDVSRDDPDLRVHVHLSAGGAELSVDTSGDSLSHRGYRPRGGPAPLAEALAAGIVLLTGYDGATPFVDPMCGTGTLAIEAALIATRTAPGAKRRFACERLPCHDSDSLSSVRADAARVRRAAPAAIVAADEDARAVAAAGRNAAEAGVAGALRVERAALRDLAPQAGAIIVMNPPYGRRLGEVESLGDLYREVGDVLKRTAAGCTAWVLAGEPRLAKRIGLRPIRRVRLFNGPIECRLLRYDLFAGSLRDRRPSADGG